MQIGSDRTRKIAAIEIIKTRMRQPFERLRQALLLEQGADLRRLSIRVEISLGEAGHVGEFAGFARRVLRLAARNRKAVRRIGDGIGEETLERQMTAERLPGPIEGEFPSR